MSRFQSLMKFSAYHAYMGNTPCPALHFELDPASRSLIDRAGLLVRNAGGSMEVLFDDSREDALKAIAAEESATLAWRMHSSDRSLAGCTSPSLMREGKTLYIRLEDGRFPDISDSEYVGESDFVDLSDDSLSGLLALRDRGEEQAGEQLVQMLDARLGQMLTPRDFLLPPLAFIVFKIESLEPRTHRVRLNTLQSYWRYRVFGGHDEVDMTVVDPDGNIDFEPQGLVEFPVPGGRLATTFKADKRLPLRARGGPRFELRPNNTSGSTALVRRLPIASATNTRLDLINGTEDHVSDIVVNL